MNIIFSMLCIFSLKLTNGLLAGTTTTTDPNKIRLIDGIDLFNHIINPHPFKYTINPGRSVCGQDKGKNVFLLIVVNSDPAKFDFRSSQRDTWAKRSLFPGLNFTIFQNDVSQSRFGLEMYQLNSQK